MIFAGVGAFNHSSNFLAHRALFQSHPGAESERLGRDSEITLEASQKFLNHQVISFLPEQIPVQETSFEKLYPDDFSPEKVANRILDAVGGILGELNLGQQNSVERDEAIRQVKQGIEKGFSEARKILADLNVLKGEIADNIDKTEGLVDTGLERLISNQNQQPSPVQSSAYASAYRVEQSQSLSLQIETKDGDFVQVEIHKNAGGERSEFFANSDTEQLSGFSETRFYNESFSFTVEGDLSKDERKEISELIRKTANFADKFSQGLFDGRLDKAIKHASRLGFKTSHLADFSLNVESVKTVQVASAYQQQFIAGSGDAALDNVARAADFVQASEELINQSKAAVEPFSKPLDALKGLVLELSRFAADSEQRFKGIAADTNQLLSSVFTDLHELSSKPEQST